MNRDELLREISCPGEVWTRIELIDGEQILVKVVKSELIYTVQRKPPETEFNAKRTHRESYLEIG